MEIEFISYLCYIKIMKPDVSDLAVAKEFKKRLKEKLGDHLISVIFYGSRAKGKSKNDSDLDLFLLMKRKPKLNSRTEDIIADLSLDYLNEKNLYISPVVYGREKFNKYRDSQYFEEVKKGILI